MKGYRGKILEVDLTKRTSEVREIPDTIYEMVLSGVGLGAWYLYENIPAGADPMGPENILGITSGLLTGTGSVMTGRWMAVCKSPLTGGWGDSNCGGNLAPAIKQCGVDAIFFRGIADSPVYLHMDNKGAEIRDAAPYWGLDAVEAEERLIADNTYGKKPAVAVIGPAGEKRSLISGISNDGGRYAARSGVGAVMGSKNLKAIVLAGKKMSKGADPEALRSISRSYSSKVRRLNLPKAVGGWFLPPFGKAMAAVKNHLPMDGMLTTLMLKRWGSTMNNTLGITSGDAPLKNWTGSVKDYRRAYYKNVNPTRQEKREVRKYHCNSCIVGCGAVCDIKDIRDGRYSHTHKPEYETVTAFGGLLMNKDLDSIFYINEMLNRGGMDTISVGGTIAFAIECYEKGLLTKDDTGGLELKWGNAETIIKLVEMMINREGIGDLLADGVKKAAERIGKGSEAFAVHAGGQELPMHDPKIDAMLGVIYSADPTPGRHTTTGGLYYRFSHLWEYVSWLPPQKKFPKEDEFIPSDGEALKAKAHTAYKMLVDGAGGCYYAMLMGEQHFRLFDFLNAATGWNLSPDEFIEKGIRIQNLRQMFNAKHGVDIRSFKMNGRAYGKPALKAGPTAEVSFNLEDMIALYNRNWGWDESTGIPKNETVESLGINDILTERYSYGR